MVGLAVLYGSIVGFALGLTGGGGGLFAVPLLVYGLSVAPREAVGISLLSVGGTAIVGVAPRLFRGDVELRTGVLFAVAGIAGAPIGTHLSRLLPETTLLILFALLMLIIAIRIWLNTRDEPEHRTSVSSTPRPRQGMICVRDEQGKLLMTHQCVLMLTALGFITGVLSGLFGVGGGFIIVPALILFSGMEIHQAIATSLLVISLVSISGVTAYVSTGNHLSIPIALEFLVGGGLGMSLGSLVARRLKGPTLQRVFSVGIVLVACFVIFRSVVG